LSGSIRAKASGSIREDEPVKKLMEMLYRMLSGLYAKIAKEQSAEFISAMGK
jgi:hypothetical protein